MPEKTIKEGFPKKIQEVVSSEKTAEEIGNICEKYGISDEGKIENIAYQTGMVLLGKLAPERLTETLEKKTQIDFKVSEKISQEINQLIFSQVKDDLVRLYGVEKKAPSSIKERLEEKAKKSPGKDTYREKIE